MLFQSVKQKKNQPQRKDSTPPQNTGRPYSDLTQPVLQKRAKAQMRGEHKHREHCEVHINVS